MKRILIVTVVLVGILGLVFGFLSWRTHVARAGVTSQIILYSGENFTGRSMTITDTTFDLPSVFNESGEEVFNWNDEVRSVIVVGGTWRLYENGRCNTQLDDTKLQDFSAKLKPVVGGWSSLVSATSMGPFKIPSVAVGGIWRDVSSVELISTQNLPDWAMDFRK